MHCKHVSSSPPEGFVVTDVTFLSPSRLATYADCQRKFDYEYVQKVNPSEKTRLYLNQGRAYHGTIEAVCEATNPEDDAQLIYDRAVEAFREHWKEHIDPNDYASRAHQEYQRLENLEALKTFFDPDGGHGIDHARQSVTTEKWLECVENGIGLHGKADNILRTDDGIHVIDYKRNLRDVITSYTASVLEDHLDGTDHDPKRVRNVFQTATYIEGVKQSDLFEEGMTVQFSFYGLLNRTSFQSTPSGYQISVRGYPRETTEIYEEHYDTIWNLLRRSHEGITSNSHDPDPFPLIHDEACPDCTFQDMCAEYLAEGVRR
jgi:putative RecB family exonuclease